MPFYPTEGPLRKIAKGFENAGNSAYGRALAADLSGEERIKPHGKATVNIVEQVVSDDLGDFDYTKW